MKKILILTLCLTTAVSISSKAEAFGKRGDKPAQLAYHLVAQEPLPGPWTTLSFADKRPILMATENSIPFLQPGGEMFIYMESPRETRIYLSERENFVGVQDLSGPGEKPESPRSLSFTLYHQQGEKIWSLKQPLSVDEPIPSFYISNLGTVVMAKPLETTFSFYNQAGSLVRKVQIFPKATAETERPVACAFSADGNHFVVNALRQHSRPGTDLSPGEKGQSFLILFDALGEEIWRRELTQEVSDRVEISSKGQVIVAGGYFVRGLDAVQRATSLYNAEGDPLARLDFPFRHAAFSTDGRFLLLGHKSSVHLVETQTGRVLWEKALPGEAGQIRALDLSPDGNLILVERARGRYQGSQFVYESPQVILFDDEGHQVWGRDFPEDRFLQPLARFLEDGARILLAFQNRYLIYARDE